MHPPPLRKNISDGSAMRGAYFSIFIARAHRELFRQRFCGNFFRNQRDETPQKVFVMRSDAGTTRRIFGSERDGQRWTQRDVA
jgi:hypothetical protein